MRKLIFILMTLGLLGSTNIVLAQGTTCLNADTLPVPSTNLGSTIGYPVQSVPFCGTPSIASGRWYVVEGNTANITATTCASPAFATKISVYTGSCGSLVCVGGNDNFCPGFGSEFSWPSTGSTMYYVLVHGFGAGTGDFQLDIKTDYAAQTSSSGSSSSNSGSESKSSKTSSKLSQLSSVSISKTNGTSHKSKKTSSKSANTNLSSKATSTSDGNSVSASALSSKSSSAKSKSSKDTNLKHEEDKFISEEIGSQQSMNKAFGQVSNGNQHLTLKAYEDDNVKIELFNLNGSRISTLFEGEISSSVVYEMELSSLGLEHGLYIYKITGSKSQIQSGKIFILR